MIKIILFYIIIILGILFIQKYIKIMLKLKIPYLFLALSITQAAHSTEEYFTRFYEYISNSTLYIHELTGFTTAVNMSGPLFILLNIGLAVILFSISFFIFKEKIWAIKLIKIIAVIEIINGFVHIIPAIYKMNYHTGCVSAVFLLIIGIMILIKMKRKEEVVETLERV